MVLLAVVPPLVWIVVPVACVMLPNAVRAVGLALAPPLPVPLMFALMTRLPPLEARLKRLPATTGEFTFKTPVVVRLTPPLVLVMALPAPKFVRFSVAEVLSISVPKFVFVVFRFDVCVTRCPLQKELHAPMPLTADRTRLFAMIVPPVPPSAISFAAVRVVCALPLLMFASIRICPAVSVKLMALFVVVRPAVPVPTVVTSKVPVDVLLIVIPSGAIAARLSVAVVEPIVPAPLFPAISSSEPAVISPLPPREFHALMVAVAPLAVIGLVTVMPPAVSVSVKLLPPVSMPGRPKTVPTVSPVAFVLLITTLPLALAANVLTTVSSGVVFPISDPATSFNPPAVTVAPPSIAPVAFRRVVLVPLLTGAPTVMPPFVSVSEIGLLVVKTPLVPPILLMVSVPPPALLLMVIPPGACAAKELVTVIALMVVPATISNEVLAVFTWISLPDAPIAVPAVSVTTAPLMSEPGAAALSSEPAVAVNDTFPVVVTVPTVRLFNVFVMLMLPAPPVTTYGSAVLPPAPVSVTVMLLPPVFSTRRVPTFVVKPSPPPLVPPIAPPTVDERTNTPVVATAVPTPLSSTVVPLIRPMFLEPAVTPATVIAPNCGLAPFGSPTSNVPVPPTPIRPISALLRLNDPAPLPTPTVVPAIFGLRRTSPFAPTVIPPLVVGRSTSAALMSTAAGLPVSADAVPIPPTVTYLLAFVVVMLLVSARVNVPVPSELLSASIITLADPASKLSCSVMPFKAVRLTGLTAPVVVTACRSIVPAESVTLVTGVPLPTAPSTMSPPPAVIASGCAPSTVPSVTSFAALLPNRLIVPPPAASDTLPALTPKPAVFTVKVPLSVVVVTPV